MPAFGKREARTGTRTLSMAARNKTIRNITVSHIALIESAGSEIAGSAACSELADGHGRPALFTGRPAMRSSKGPGTPQGRNETRRME